MYKVSNREPLFDVFVSSKKSVIFAEIQVQISSSVVEDRKAKIIFRVLFVLTFILTMGIATSQIYLMQKFNKEVVLSNVVGIGYFLYSVLRNKTP